jgi:hypothetical protein
MQNAECSLEGLKAPVRAYSCQYRFTIIGHADMARSRRCGVIVAADLDNTTPYFQQRDKAFQSYKRPTCC